MVGGILWAAVPLPLLLCCVALWSVVTWSCHLSLLNLISPDEEPPFTRVLHCRGYACSVNLVSCNLSFSAEISRYLGILMQCSHFSHLPLLPWYLDAVHCIKIPVQCSAAIWDIWVSVHCSPGILMQCTASRYQRSAVQPFQWSRHQCSDLGLSAASRAWNPWHCRLLAPAVTFLDIWWRLVPRPRRRRAPCYCSLRLAKQCKVQNVPSHFLFKWSGIFISTKVLS